ncbi:2-amino-4-oxopentanoate thiolase subunit OrtA [Vallitalea okinawensis]|uniref:2-amino-4-oxopentanoate thiolase subunit OrtA n=1 Tax=Vallitalea okinawensis TaxID=2078660 RepID=UPI000CFAAF08|nr:2-amino-4-oxopentanoate thiolase subunit OrtA [Vallitalea okinawensis]
MNKAKKNDWVKIHNIILGPEERAPQVPEDTKKVPLELWVKGYLIDEKAEIGDTVVVKTVTGRRVSGSLIEIEPSFNHDFGSYVKELAYIGPGLRELLKGGEHRE